MGAPDVHKHLFKLFYSDPVILKMYNVRLNSEFSRVASAMQVSLMVCKSAEHRVMR